MGLPVVTVSAGGLPVVESTTGGTPVTEAANGYGVPVTKVVGKPGLPVVFETIGVAPAPVPTTWNLADKSANMSLTNGNLTATSTNFSVGVRAVAGKSAGKWYFETTMANGGSAADVIGLGLAGAVLTTTGPAGTVVVFPSFINVNASSVLAFSGMANGVVVGKAIDLDAKLIWFRIAPTGNWNNNAANNPATGVGGVNIAVIATGPLYPIFQVGAASGHAATANFGASAFVGAVPAGFTSGWPA